MTDQPTLKQQAEDFAGELTQTVHAVVVDSPPFKVDSVDGGSKFVIQQDSKTGIELTVDSQTTAVVACQLPMHFGNSATTSRIPAKTFFQPSTTTV